MAPSLLEHIGHDVGEGALAGRDGLLPAGSIEYHGPHGPLGTDTFIARDIAARVAARRPGLVLLPELAYMPCPPETRGRPGTVAISERVAIALLEELLRGLFGAGLRAVVVVNAHVGNVAALAAAAGAVRPGPVHVINWWETLPAQETAALAGFTENGGHGHAGPVEMSVTQAIVPALVRPELAPGVAIDRGAGEALLALAVDRVAAAADRALGGATPGGAGAASCR